MQIIDTTPQRAEDALVAIAGHVPADIALGRPQVAWEEADGATQMVTTTGTWWLEPGGSAARLVPLAGGRVELTRWRAGQEITRTVGRVPD